MPTCEHVSKSGKECVNNSLFMNYPVCKRHAKLKTVQVRYGIDPDSIRDEEIEAAMDEAEEAVRKDERKKIQKTKIEAEREKAIDEHPLNIDITDLEPGEKKKKKKKVEEEPVEEEVPDKPSPKKKKSRFIDTEELNQIEIPDVPQKGTKASRAKRQIDEGFNAILGGKGEPDVPKSKKKTKIAPDLPREKRRAEPELEEEEEEEEFEDEDDFDDEESPVKRPSNEAFSRGMLLIGYRTMLGLAEVYSDPHLRGLANTTMGAPGIKEVLDECSDELHEMMGLDDMDCWTKLLLITTVAAGVTYSKNIAIGVNAPMVPMSGPPPVSISQLNVPVEVPKPIPVEIVIPEGSEDL